MISYHQAKQILNSTSPVLAEETIPLTYGAGRILSQNLYARVPSPPFTNSAMDGYALRHSDADLSSDMEVLGAVMAEPLKHNSLPEYRPGGCVRVMTGAMLPPWADTVIRSENTTLTEKGFVRIQSPLPAKGSNVRLAGEDLKEGQVVMLAGTLLKPEHVMIAAALGHDNLRVLEKPRLVILLTGNELTDIGQPLPPGSIYNSSKYFLLNATRELGISPTSVTTIPDSSAVASEIIEKFCCDNHPTVIISTGAVSMGEADFIPQVASHLGFEVGFHRVAIRPGKPVFFASRNNIAWLGLPGNPISTAIGWHIFARPLLARWFGCSEPQKARLILKNEVRKPEELRCYFRAEVNNGKAWIARRQGSAEFAASISCSAYVELPEGVGRFAADTTVEAIIL